MKQKNPKTYLVFDLVQVLVRVRVQVQVRVQVPVLVPVQAPVREDSQPRPSDPDNRYFYRSVLRAADTCYRI